MVVGQLGVDPRHTVGLERLDEISRSDSGIRRFWDGLPLDERQRFTDGAKRWLFFFRELFDTAKSRIKFEVPLVGMLTEQHRMHPSIGTMISQAFYGGRITNRTRRITTHSRMRITILPSKFASVVSDKVQQHSP